MSGCAASNSEAAAVMLADIDKKAYNRDVTTAAMVSAGIEPEVGRE
jgi:hypothetical protein